MEGITRFIVFVAMVMLTTVSMWTTYVSLNDSILPEPKLPIPITEGVVWECSVFALALSVAIGLMLFALKLAIIDGHKRLSVVGIVGLVVVAFISISFNMDVLYRTADRDFFMNYSRDQTLSVYENYLAEAQSHLTEKRDTLRKELATQEAELSSEIEGIRQAPAGFGPRAREEQYRLKLLESATAVDLETLEGVLAQAGQADELLKTAAPENVSELHQLQNEIRVLVREVGVHAGIPLPEPVKADSPIFAVFAKLFDYQNVGMKEVFFLLIAIFLDLGDIVGYSLVPAAKGRRKPELLEVKERVRRQAPAEYVPDWNLLEEQTPAPIPQEKGDFFGESKLAQLPMGKLNEEDEPPRKRSFRIGRSDR